jgi:hypothetical protein
MFEEKISFFILLFYMATQKKDDYKYEKIKNITNGKIIQVGDIKIEMVIKEIKQIGGPGSYTGFTPYITDINVEATRGDEKINFIWTTRVQYDTERKLKLDEIGEIINEDEIQEIIKTVVDDFTKPLNERDFAPKPKTTGGKKKRRKTRKTKKKKYRKILKSRRNRKVRKTRKSNINLKY